MKPKLMKCQMYGRLKNETWCKVQQVKQTRRIHNTYTKLDRMCYFSPTNMNNPKSYIHTIQVTNADIDSMGHVNNVVYLRYVQEAASAHWAAQASEDLRASALWVVLRHEIDYLAPAFTGDVLHAETWVGEVTGVKSIRFVTITNAAGKTIIKAKTVWCMVDAKTLRPKRIEPYMMESFL